jgi:hypothetical protein
VVGRHIEREISACSLYVRREEERISLSLLLSNG